MLQDFSICINTKFIFGQHAEKQLASELKKMKIKKVLLHHDNGKFLYETGLLTQIKRQLEEAEIAYVELGGVLPNPRLSLVREGIALAKEEQVELVLAIGGGSVIDSAKAIGLGAVTDEDVWTYFLGQKEPKATLPIGSLVTYPASGSESSAVTVVNNTDTGMKLLVSHPIVRPVIAFMNPALTYSLPAFLTACGIVDMFSHVCERYFSSDDEIGVIDRMSEGILQTLVDIGPKLMLEPANYAYRADLMWIATIAQNNTVGIGRSQDWATHALGNELSALYDTPHGATISIMMGSWMRYVYQQKPERFARYAQEVFGIEWHSGNTIVAAYEGILQTEAFFKKLKMPISFQEGHVPIERIEELLDRIPYENGDVSIGGLVRLNREDCREIYKMATDGVLRRKGGNS